ncbi:MAG: AraC family transcriptional regulator [Bacteroidaceae bacterium]|nr:AraC family transcriptional regulator [Bacteroidaceae bacterium]
MKDRDVTDFNKWITKGCPKATYFSSFEDKYLVVDNLDEKEDPLISPCEASYNSEYFYMLIVLRGTLHIVIGGTEIEVKANEYLSVRPCMTIKLQESRCFYVSLIARNCLMTDILEHSTLCKMNKFHAFSFSHLRFDPEQINALLHCYRTIKNEHMRDHYPMMEMVHRAYITAFLAKLCSFIQPTTYIPHTNNSKQYSVFTKFLDILSNDHKQERSVQYYAKTLKITPKYLSTIVHNFTGLSASQVIDNYVIYAVKQMLYANDCNIKTISEDFHFPSQSFFGRYFKRITGMSPNKYVKENNRKSLNFMSKNRM